ncbi:helix-turn-helix transcriptional regulator [Streptomyces hirsutus]|uniref:helix-turn-helix transcriptional regulator n=1 Tax=Streptomyces hirsutus TaxID=35620 RepID=UPI0036478900
MCPPPYLAGVVLFWVPTVSGYFEAVGASGVPVRAARGPEGGYRLMEGYRTRLTGLTDAEAGSLFLAGLPGPARDLGLGAVLASAQLKVEAALPGELADQARRVRERFHLDAPAWFRDADPVPHLERISGAVWERRVLRARYRRWRGEVHREVCPLGLVLKGGIWYLVALAENPENIVRTYRVSRFQAVEETGDLFTRPAGFALAAYWAESSRRMEAALRQGTARLRLSPRGQKLLPMQFGAAGVRALREAGPPDGEGWVEVELSVESEAVATGDLLRLGTEAEVLGPPGLRQAVAGAVAVLAERYAAGR